jgi:tetratricopeptide (TPR) repeat protein
MGNVRFWPRLEVCLLVASLPLAGCAFVPLKGGACGSDFGPSPFRRKNATHILVADFWAHRSAGPDFADSVTEQVDAELRRFREEVLRNPEEFDIEVPEESLELGRLPCFVQGHEQAREAARALGADVVVWGKAYCNAPGGATSAQVQVDAQTGDIKTGDRSSVSSGNVTVQTGKPYAVCPSATLVRSGVDLRQSARAMDLGSIADLDLPLLESTKPFMLVRFAMGLHFYEQQHYWLAARLFRNSAANVLSTEPNTESLDTLLGYVYQQLPDYERSLEHSRRALKRVEGRGNAQEATLLNNIGSALQAQGKFVEALDHYQRALALLENAHGVTYQDTAAPLSNIGSLLKTMGQYGQALEHYRRALVITERALGREHPIVAIHLLNIGCILQTQGQHAQALAHYQRALAINTKVFGDKHPSFALALNSVGNALIGQGQYEQALEYYHRALIIATRALGNDHSDIAAYLSNIGRALQGQELYSQALEYFGRALVIDEKIYGDSHPQVAHDLNSIGGVLYIQGKYAPALERYHRALKINKNAFGDDHPEVSATLQRVGATFQMQGQYPRALEHYRHALAIQVKAHGNDHPNVALVWSNIGTVFQAQGQYPQALENYQHAINILAKALGHGDPTTKSVSNNVAVCLAEKSGFVADPAKGFSKGPRGVVVLRCWSECQGLQQGDWLLTYNNIPLRSAEQLGALMTATPPGRAVALSVMRNRKRLTLPARGGALGAELY